MVVLYTIEILGTLSFAISGALVASDKNLDLFGVVMIAFVTAVGGGMLRDVLINAHPVNWIADLNYIRTIMAGVLITYLFKSKIAYFRKTMFLFDTLGISVFTLLGLQKGLDFNLHPFVGLVMGVLSAVMGGVIRDVLTNELPLIFQKEIYAFACFSGGLVYLMLGFFSVQPDIQFIVSALVIIGIRIVAVRYGLALPKVKDDLFGKHIAGKKFRKK